MLEAKKVGTTLCRAGGGDRAVQGCGARVPVILAALCWLLWAKWYKNEKN